MDKKKKKKGKYDDLFYLNVYWDTSTFFIFFVVCKNQLKDFNIQSFNIANNIGYLMTAIQSLL